MKDKNKSNLQKKRCTIQAVMLTPQVSINTHSIMINDHWHNSPQINWPEGHNLLGSGSAPECGSNGVGPRSCEAERKDGSEDGREASRFILSGGCAVRSRFVRSRLFHLRAMVGLPTVFSTLSWAHSRPGGAKPRASDRLGNTNTIGRIESLRKET